jgi:hypothetical protein
MTFQRTPTPRPGTGVPGETISENYPSLGARFRRLLPREGEALHAVSPAPRPFRAVMFGGLLL